MPRPRPVWTPGPRASRPGGGEAEDEVRGQGPPGPASLRRVLGDRGLGHPGPWFRLGLRLEGPASAPNPFLVVAHVPLAGPGRRSEGEPSDLAAELEHGGLIDLETVRRIACDATVVVAVDDAVGPHHVRGPGQALPDRGPTARGDPPGPALPVPGLCERHLRRRAPRRALEPRWRDRPRQSGPSVQAPPRGGAPQRLVHDGQPQSRSSRIENPERPGHASRALRCSGPG